MDFVRRGLDRLKLSLSLTSIPLLSLSLSPAAAALPQASRYDIVGTGATAISVATYQANELLEDRWAVLTSSAAAKQPTAIGDVNSRFERNGKPLLFASVMDGHGGWQASEYTRKALPLAVFDELQNASDIDDPLQISSALTRAFQRTDRGFIDSVRGAFELGFGAVARVGCCTLGAVISSEWIVVANAGDCRAVLGHVSRTPPETGARARESVSPAGASEGGGDGDAQAVTTSAQRTKEATMETLFVTAIPLSDDHNARLPREVARLRAAHPGEADIVVSTS